MMPNTTAYSNLAPQAAVEKAPAPETAIKRLIYRLEGLHMRLSCIRESQTGFIERCIGAPTEVKGDDNPPMAAGLIGIVEERLRWLEISAEALSENQITINRIA